MEDRRCTSHLVTCLLSTDHSSGDNNRIYCSFFSGIGSTSECSLNHIYATECEGPRLRVRVSLSGVVNY